MNTSAIYYPSVAMQKTIREFKNDGITRVEISYYADSIEAEDIILDDNFVDRANKDIDAVKSIFDKTTGIIYQLGMKKLLQSF